MEQVPCFQLGKLTFQMSKILTTLKSLVEVACNFNKNSSSLIKIGTNFIFVENIAIAMC